MKNLKTESNMFDAYAYLDDVKNRLPELATFKMCRVSSRSEMEEMVDSVRTENAWLCVDDSDNGKTMNIAGGYVDRRVFFAFILQKYDTRTKEAMNNQAIVMENARTIYKKILTKLIHDKESMSFGLTNMRDDFQYYELPSDVMPGVAGLYFAITVDTPVDLCYNPNDWTL